MANRGPSQEYLLQGSILDESVEILLHRLKGISDNAEDGLTRFKEHEIVYGMREGNNMTTVNMRARKSISSPEQPWTLCYLGHPELGDRNRPTTVRTCVEANCTQNVRAFLQELGFRMEFEFVSQGWLFRKGRLKATVSKIFRIINQGNFDHLAPISKSHLVEVSTISGSANEQAANDVSQFSELLKPLVNLEKKDPRRPEMQSL